MRIVSLPPFPSKRYFANNPEARFIRNRCYRLETYLNTLLKQNPLVMFLHFFQEFLFPTSEQWSAALALPAVTPPSRHETNRVSLPLEENNQESSSDTEDEVELEEQQIAVPEGENYNWSLPMNQWKTVNPRRAGLRPSLSILSGELDLVPLTARRRADASSTDVNYFTRGRVVEPIVCEDGLDLYPRGEMVTVLGPVEDDDNKLRIYYHGFTHEVP